MKKLLIAFTAIAVPFFSVAHAEDNAMLLKSRALAAQLPPKLLAVLKSEIEKSGPEGAIQVCKDEAPKIAGELSRESHATIRRVSLKSRNAVRATPDAWEKGVLEEFDRRAAAGETPATLEKGETVGSEYRYMKALPVQAGCLACHGTVDKIKPAVKAMLEKHYPGDTATGYSEGQIRGAISVRTLL